MCEICNTYNSIHVNAVNYDPTRTVSLRNSFSRDLNKRFRGLGVTIQTALINQNVLGIYNRFTVPPRNAFNFPRSSDKINEFMTWINRQINAGILEIGETQQLGSAIESAWTNVYIRDSYRRGVLRARAEMRKAGFNVPPLAGNEAEIIAALNNPFHIDRVGLLFTRTYTELKGITDNMASMISRVLAQGMIDGDSPRTIALKMRKLIEGIGDLSLTDTLGRFIPASRRAEILARTEIIRAHHQAMVQEYKNWGIAGVKVKAEFLTAGDDRVCPDCQALEGEIFTLERAFGLIPVHPSCRCITLPYRELGESIVIPKQF